MIPLHQINKAIQEKRLDREDEIILFHDNVRLHMAKVAKGSRRESGIFFAPSIFHRPRGLTLFRSLANDIRNSMSDSEDGPMAGLVFQH